MILQKRNVFLYWIGSEYKLISILRNLIYLHSTNGIGYNIILITHENINDYVDNIPKYFYDLCPAHQADFVRVHVICDYGGIWLDSDTLILDTLDSLFDIIENKDGFLIKENNNELSNGIFGSKKETEFMQEWKKNLRMKLDITKGKIEWTDVGNDMLEYMFNLNPSLFENYKIFQGLDNLYPVNWNNCVAEFITKPYDNYKNIIRNYQPFIVLVNSVYHAFENKTINEILNGNMPINYFINKSLQNIGISKNKLNNGYQIYNYGDKDYISKSIIDYETWEPNITCLMNNIINKNEYSENVILDIGCNIGYHTLITQKYNSISHVYSVDGNNVNINLLELSCGINNISNVTLINKCIADKPEESFETANQDLIDRVNNIGGLSYKKSKNNTGILSTTIDELIEKNKITNILIMKIDIEGGELNSLKGATTSLKTNIIKNIIIAITPKFNNDSKAILDILHENDYVLYNIPHKETGYLNTDNNLLENIKSSPITNISEFVSSISVQTNILAIKCTTSTNIAINSNKNEKIFSKIYKNSLWNNNNPSIPLSGPGSSLENTREVITLLEEFIYKHNCTSILDLGCGDLTWISKTKFFLDNKIQYNGIDVVSNLINSHKTNYPNKTFLCKDITKFSEFNKASIVILRDVIFHLEIAEILNIFNNIKNKFDFICITSCRNTENNDKFNRWKFSERNIHLKPFNIPYTFKETLFEKKFNRNIYIYDHSNFYQLKNLNNKIHNKKYIIYADWIESYLALEPFTFVKNLEKYGWKIMKLSEIDIEKLKREKAIILCVTYDSFDISQLKCENITLIYKIDDLYPYEDIRKKCIDYTDFLIGPYQYLFKEKKIIEMYPSINTKESYHIPYSAVNSFYKNIDFNNTPKEIIFISGNINCVYPFRKHISKFSEYIERLEHPSYNNYKHKIINEEYYNKLAEYLCCFTDASCYNYILLKVFEICSVGSLLLCDESIKNQLYNLGFHDNIHYIACNKDNLELKMKWILDKKNRKIVDEMRLRGMDLVRNNHSTSCRSQAFDAIINNKYLKSE